MAGSKSSNSQAVDFQKEQARKAEQKEAERSARLQSGMDIINQIYEGKPVYENVSTKYDWGGFSPATGGFSRTKSGDFVKSEATGVPTGYKAIQVDDPSWKATTSAPASGQSAAQSGGTMAATGGTTAANMGNIRNAGYMANGTGAAVQYDNAGRVIKTQYQNQNQALGGDSGKDAAFVGTNNSTAGSGQQSANKVWALQGPDGKIYYQGDDFSYDTQKDTGKKEGGFGDEFFNEYKQDYLDLYQPEEERQYGFTNRDLTYNLARQGLGRSSTAAEKQGEMGYQHALNQAQIVADASSEEAKMRDAVDEQKKAVIAQLYATEDPAVAQNLAASSAKGLQLQNPSLTPGTQFFAPAISAVGSFAAQQGSNYNFPKYSSGGGGNVAGAGSSQGKNWK